MRDVRELIMAPRIWGSDLGRGAVFTGIALV